MTSRRAAVLGTSLLLILPVLLQRHVQAGDLASHLYNTWLVLLVKSGEPLGLEIVPQYSGVLFDWWLEGLWRLGGPVFAEKTAVSVSVLLFFWGSFFLLSRLNGRPAWPSAPLLAMLAYGWVYHRGFFNYYLSCAFGFWAVGLAASRGWQRWLAAPTLAFAVLGHLLGAVTSGGFVAYILLWDRLPARHRRWLFAAAVLALIAVAAAAAAALPSAWKAARFIHLTAATPVLAYGSKYMVPGLILASFWALAVHAAWRPGKSDPGSWSVSSSLAVLTAAALVALPASLHWPGTLHPLHFIDWRLALWFTLLLHGSLAHRLPQRLTALACSAGAAVFFVFLAHDWRVLGQLEQALHSAVRAAPPRSRVVADITAVPLDMNPLIHMIDRACIGHCFSYANYEPSTAQFRLRALPRSPAVLDSPEKVLALHQGRYVVRQQDLPLYGIFLQGAHPPSFQVRSLQAGEQVRRTRVNVPPDWF